MPARLGAPDAGKRERPAARRETPGQHEKGGLPALGGCNCCCSVHMWRPPHGGVYLCFALTRYIARDMHTPGQPVGMFRTQAQQGGGGAPHQSTAGEHESQRCGDQTAHTTCDQQARPLAQMLKSRKPKRSAPRVFYRQVSERWVGGVCRWRQCRSTGPGDAALLRSPG